MQEPKIQIVLQPWRKDAKVIEMTLGELEQQHRDNGLGDESVEVWIDGQGKRFERRNNGRWELAN